MRNDNSEILQLPLDEILINNGYSIKKNKSSRRYTVLSNENDDTVIVSRHSNGHYLYFNPNDDTDRGNIFNFCKNRGIKTSDILSGKEIPSSPSPQKDYDFSQTSVAAVMEFDKMPEIADKNLLTDKRFLSADVISNFSSIKQDKYGNANFPSFALKKMQNNNKQYTIITKCGYVSYLNNPITKSKDGTRYEKPIKQLCHGNKGLEIVKSDACKSFKEVKNIIICESMIDALSAVELKKFDAKSTLVCSTNGQICGTQKEALEYLAKNTKSRVFLGFDNDEKGQQFTQIALEIMPNAEAIKPVLKDFNDDLAVARLLNLNENFSEKDVSRKILEMEKSARAALSKFDLYYPQERQKLENRFMRVDKRLFELVAPRVRNFVNIDKLGANYEAFAAKISNNLQKTF